MEEYKLRNHIAIYLILVFWIAIAIIAAIPDKPKIQLDEHPQKVDCWDYVYQTPTFCKGQ